MEDPVLLSYGRCLSADILCVWRRTWAGPPRDPASGTPRPGPTPSQKQTTSLRHSPKELWIFWYGDEPDLSNLVAPELAKTEEIRGSWDSVTGMSYECRTLVFKALHNLIERCLLTRDFVRLGRWFVQPYEGPEGVPASRSTHLSFCLSFFVHGESIVCASVDVRQHPPVRLITRRHLQLAQQSTHGIPVILGPYGLSGTLTGATFRLTDQTTQKLMDDWQLFFPIDFKNSSSFQSSASDSSFPPVVEVIVGGHKMRYPSCYALVTDLDDYLLLSRGNGVMMAGSQHGRGVAPNGAMKGGLTGEAVADSPPGDSIPHHISPFTASTHTLLTEGGNGRNLGWSRDMCERVWQDVVMCPGQQQVSHDALSPEGTLTPAEIAGQWDFADPATKMPCTCTKLGTPCGVHNSFSGYKGGGIPTPGSVPSLRLHGVADGPPASVESATSVTPSPLPTPHSQPASVPHHDPSQSTLSPHGTSCGEPNTPSNTAMETTDSKPNMSDLMGIKSEPSLNTRGISPYETNDGQDGHEGSSDNSRCMNSSSAYTGTTATYGTPLPRGLKRPSLPADDYHNLLEKETNSNCLYDYSNLNAWFHNPVKKFKTTEIKSEGPLWPPYRPPHVQQHMEHTLRKEQSENITEVNGYPMKRSGGLKRPPDPYDFDDETSINTLETYKRKEEKEDAKGPGSVRSCHDPQSPSSREKKSGSLYTSAGLQPSYSDLDEIFDSSDSPADDGAFPDHTPPGSNKPVGGPDDTAVVKNNSNNKSSVNVGLVELTKMFPTPPSHEHNPDHDSMQDDPQGIQVISVKQERIEEPKPVNFGMHQDTTYVKEEVKENSASVYKPPLVCMYEGSPRYAPLTGLHSQKESILPLPMHCIYKPQAFFGQYSISEKGPGNNGHPGLGPMGGGPTGALGGSSINAGVTTQTKVGMSPISPLVGGPPSEGGPTSRGGPGSVGPGGPGSAGPPLNYELPSPASNQSSYLNKTLPSVEPPSIGVSQVPEANSLIVNIVLQDSSINLFRDHNFDSCTMCVCNVCNNNSKVVGNIRGNDGTLYLPPSQISCEEESIKCNCGFSAVVNRRLAFRSGLFYEDEVDLCGLHESLATERKKNSLILLVDSKGGENPERDSSILDQIPQSMFELLRSQCLVTLSTPGSVLYRSTTVYQNTRRDILLNTVDYKDGNETAVLAVDQSRCVFSCDNGDLGPSSLQQHSDCMHKWCYFQFEGPTCSKDIVRCMKALQPFLQEAVQTQGKKVNWEPVFSVEGPLTWRQFHRMAVRGTEDMAEPLPVPMLLTGHEKDWLSIAPQSVRHWEKLLLEPYSQQRNVAYVVVAPDNEFILSHVRTFFKELSSIYELCKLGRHAPIQRVLRNGIMRVSKNAASKVANEAFDEWFSLLGDSQMCTKLKVYAQVCRHWLAPHLATLNMDKSLFEAPSTRSTTERQAPSPMPPPSSDSGVAGSTTPTRTEGDSFMSGQNSTGSESRPGGGSGGSSSGGGSVFGPGSSLVEVEEEECPPPAILVYLVDPFSVGQDHPDMHRLVTLGLLRCYKYMLEGLSETMQNNVYLQIVSLESILELSGESNDRSRYMEQLKSLAFSVFMQCRRMLTHTGNVRSLTGFGPAATFDSFLKPKDLLDQEKKLAPYHIFSPAYILAPFKESRGRHKEAEEALGAPREKSTILYCTYCLSEDQRWLLATATDELGEILETVTINIEIPNRTRRKKASARRCGLKKLMDWILSVMSVGVHPWRLVVGRLGRMGHGELKGWSSLLSRKSLIQASKTLKENCKQCAYLFPGDAPCILSACLVSLEPDSSFRMMPDMFTPDERFGQNSQNCSLSTPQDITCTHILVFPTSAIAQSAQHRFQDEFHLGEDENLLLNEDDLDDGGMNDMIGMGPGGMGINFNDILGLDQGPGPDDQIMDVGQTNSLSNPTSPNHIGGTHSPSHFSGQAGSNGVVMVDPEEDGGQVLQQPLALGYYVSTASTGRLPRWFWSSCPHLETSCPVFLKSALHLHSAGVTQAEDFMHNSKNNVHPLDSTYTTDVLRYVLEGYNGLSWLVLDPAKQDRRSCLPIHMQVLAHLYNVMAALV
ncbi:unnamed protein product [Meganyctiphanes norvegica]|uniref:Mediator of RNA polymerase II transcription subunit 13 n=1 Tax=Meganyctiphanes norvegica TaxID=48144 RepID=A0AAV2PPJ4_MEGNR